MYMAPERAAHGGILAYHARMYPCLMPDLVFCSSPGGGCWVWSARAAAAQPTMLQIRAIWPSTSW